MQELDVEKMGLTELTKEEMNKIWGGQLVEKDISFVEYGIPTSVVYPGGQSATSGLMSKMAASLLAACH